MSKSYALFLGCYIPAVQPYIESSLRKVAQPLGMKLVDIEGASCCPAPDVVRLTDQNAWLHISARNLALAEALANDVLVLCNGCWESLYDTRELLLNDSNLMAKVNEDLATIGKQFAGKARVRHIIEVLAEDIGIKKIKKAVKHPLRGLRVGIHYGCKLYKSEEEKLVSYFDEILQTLGLDIVDYGGEKVCCGYPLSLYSFDRAIDERTRWKFEQLKEAKVDAIVTSCPGCYDTLEKSQFILRRKKEKYDIPMFHLIELIALALGFNPKEIGIDRHRIRSNEIVNKLGLEVSA